MEVDSIELKPNAAVAVAASTSSSSSASLPDSSTNAANNNNNNNNLRGASKFLLNLPSRGLFSSTVPSSNPGGLRIYVCEHETSPPEEQIITTNQQNILIRSLTLKKQKNDSSLKDGKSKAATETAKGKRAAERALDGRAKRATMTSRNAQQEGSSSRPAEKGFPFQSLTVEKLRGLLKQRGLPTRGKKEELISRLRKDDNVDGEA